MYQEVMRDIKIRYQQEQAQFKQSSYADILARHQQSANEQNLNRVTPMQGKAKEGKGLEI